MIVLEAMARQAARLAERRAAARRSQLAARIGDAAPKDVTVTVEDEAVVMSGRGLVRRLTLDPALRWLVAENRHER